MNYTIKGMQIGSDLYNFKDAVARETMANMNTIQAITQEDIDEVCATSGASVAAETEGE